MILDENDELCTTTLYGFEGDDVSSPYEIEWKLPKEKVKTVQLDFRGSNGNPMGNPMGMIGDLKIYYTSASNTEKDSEEVTTPECAWTWEEQEDGYFIPGWTSHGQVQFNTLEEAKESCLELPLENGCAGVTYTNHHANKYLYSPRKGPTLKKNEGVPGLKSWLRKWKCTSDNNDSA